MKDEWKVVSVEPAKPLPEEDPWKVVAVSLKPGETGVSPAVRSANQRFGDNFKDAQQHTFSGALGDGAAAAVVPGARDANRERGGDFRRRSEADKWHDADALRVELPDKIAFPFAPGGEIDLPDVGVNVKGLPAKAIAGVATLGGQVAGAVSSPESIIAPGRTMVGRILGAGAVNAGIDASVQPIQKQSGVIEEYDPWRVVASGAAGMGIQGTGEVLVKGAKAATPAIKGAGRKVGQAVADGLEHVGRKPMPSRAADLEPWTVVDTAPAAPKAPHVDDVWGKLIQQESGNRQFDDSGALIRSPKGAGGAAQLMPATAKEVAAKLGRPELADLAFQPTDAGREANEILGREYYRQMLDRFGGDHELAAAAYNAGPGRVSKALNKYGREGVIARLPTETQNYVRNVVGDGSEAPVRYAGEPRVDELEARLRNEQEAAATAAEDAARAARNAERQAADERGAESFGDDAQAPRQTFDQPTGQTVVEAPKPERFTVEREPAHEFELTGKSHETDGITYAQVRRYTPGDAEPNSTQFVEVTGKNADPDIAVRFNERSPELLRDRDAQPIGSARADNPIPETPTVRQEPDTPAAPARDLTDEALDLMRSGKSVRVNRGPSLLEFLQAHGVKDEGGELSNIGLDLWHRDKPFKSKLVRAEGRTLEDVAIMAQEQGYLPTRFGADVDTRATPADLISAMREELAGRPRFANENPEAQALRDHIDDLDQIANELGLDINQMSNADIKAAIDRAFSTPENVGARGAVAALEAPAQVSPALARYRDRADILQSTKPGALRHQRDRVAVAEGQGVEHHGKPVKQMLDELRASLDITHRRGRLRGRKSLGEYSKDSGVVRTKHADDFDVFSHEAAHALEFTHKPKALIDAMARHEKVLAKFDYDPKQSRRHEGFAEWFRWYVTNPDVARQMAPTFHDEFEDAMGREMPKALAAFRQAQKDWDNHLKSDSLAVAAADIVQPGEPGWLSKAFRAVQDRGVGGAVADGFDRFYTERIDSLYPIQKATRILQDLSAKNNGARADIAAADSPYVLARLHADASQKGMVDALYGVVPYRGHQPEGPSLGDAITKVFGKKWDDGQLDQFDAYLIARRMIHKWDEFKRGEIPNPPDKLSKAEHEQVIKDFEAKHPEAAEGAKLIYEWQDNLWKKRLDAGLITNEQYVAAKAKPDYVPAMRDMSDVRAGGGSESSSATGGVKRFKGSRRAKISPIASMMKQAHDLNSVIGTNEVVRTLVDLADRAGPGSGAIVETLPPTQIEAFRVDLEAALEAKAKEMGLADADRDTLIGLIDVAFSGDMMATVFRRSGFVAKPGERFVPMWKGGRMIPVRLPDGVFGQELFNAITGMSTDMRSGLVDGLALLTQSLRAGVTLSPEFQAANIFRDQLATWITTDVGYKPFLSYGRGAFEHVRNGDLSKSYGAIGGLKGGQVSVALRKSGPSTPAEAAARRRELNTNFDLGRSAGHIATHPFESLARLTEMSEGGTRLGVYRLAFEKAKKRGLSDYEAAVEAGITSRDYLDFGRHGSRMLTATRLVTFLNAALQGLDKNARVLTGSGFDRPNLGNLRKVLLPLGKGAPKTAAEKAAVAHAYKAAVRIAIVSTFGASLSMLYRDDPEYQEFNDQRRATNWMFRVNGQWWRLPKPFELAIPGNILERAIEAKLGDDPTAVKRMFTDLRHTLLPPTSIPGISTVWEIGRNRDHSGRPIVPDHLKGKVDPEYQYTHYTSRLGRVLGEQLGVSPAVLDHIVTGFTGSLGRDFLRTSDAVVEKATGAPHTAQGPEDAFLTRRFAADPQRGSKSQVRFYELVSGDGGEFTKAEGSFRMLMRQGKDEEAIRYLNGLRPEARAFVRAKVFSKDGSSKLHPLVRAQESVAVLSDIRRDIKDGKVATMRGTPIDLTPEQRRAADDAMEDLANAEMRDALIGIGEKGWAQKDLVPRAAALDALRAVDPRLRSLVLARQAEQKIPSPKASAQAWGEARERLEAPADAKPMARALSNKRLKSSDRTTKREEAVRLAGQRQ